MFLTDTQLGQSLVKNSTIAFSKGAKLAPMAGRKMFNVRATDRMITENDTYVYDSTAQLTPEGGNYHQSDAVKGFNLIHRQAKFTDSHECTKEIHKFDKYDVAKELKRITGLGTSAVRALELRAQLLIGMGAGPEYTDQSGNVVSTRSADGKNVFSTNHTVRTGETYSNIQAIALGRAGLEAHENLFRKFPNHAGRQTMTMADTVYLTRDPENQNLLYEYLNATNHIEDTNRGINAYKGKFNIVTMEYLDANPDESIDPAKSKYWGLVKAGSPELQIEVSQDPAMYTPQMIIRNRNLVTQTDIHFSTGIRDATAITLSNV